MVASLNRPGGNITGVVFTVVPLVAKLLGMLHELVPKASMIAVLRDPNGPDVESEARDLEEAARAIGHQILMVNAANEREVHAAFAKVVQAGAGGLLIGVSPATLPVMQPTKFELVINLKTAQTLGLKVPEKLLALADEVIE